MTESHLTKESLNALVQRVEDAASALIGGNVRRYLSLLPHTEDYSLMNPFGGDPIRGFDDSPESVEAQERFFAGSGEASLEVVSVQASGDLAVIVAIERQHGEVGGLPPQDLSLRVTLVFRFEENEWRLAHRHADPLVHTINLEQLSALLRG